MFISMNSMNIIKIAEEGKILRDKANEKNETIEDADISMKKVLGIVEQYQRAYNMLPYPLNSIEKNIKYCVIIELMGLATQVAWIKNGLNIKIAKNCKIKFIGEKWFIQRAEEGIDHSKPCLEEYNKTELYKHYKSALDILKNKEDIGKYYKEFFDSTKEEVEEAGQNLFKQKEIPDKMKLHTNWVIDLETESEYMINVYPGKKKESTEKEVIISLLGSQSNRRKKSKEIQTFKYTAFERAGKKALYVDKENERYKLKISKLSGLFNLYITVASLMNGKDALVEYKGFIADGYIVYEVGNNIYIAKAKKFSETKKIAEESQIYAYKNGMLYFLKLEQTSQGNWKECIYSCSLKETNNIKIKNERLVIPMHYFNQ